MVPPGLAGDLIEAVSGGSDLDWLPLVPRKLYTNAFIVQDGKRGFGKDKYNGFGGKVDPGETVAEAAARELKEEAGIEAPLEHCGTLLFISETLDFAHHIEYYRASTYTGDIIETEEMRPQWFSFPPEFVPNYAGSSDAHDLPPIPLDAMWEDDHHFLPFILGGRHFVGRADFGMQGEQWYSRRFWFGVPAADHANHS
ncbi:hypothetical protein JAAARDRAFT_596937 [Jaapia argillacea MUCL 33604]|uniref:Nudix hydrolase domain-containing protein n=1 Tax=Jaapia argillacea MUCL 33604 TaxID=933084 RepID=A0A067PZ87_9AGAM|nr:hypothetical protein JAAARDRAFT_596937 [Jaapia argillacea MUCL 33604]